ncbi:MAG: SAM-dependent methyltransferase [Syntrophus sp. (in: bacteria)]|nr:SAM-dependent methyltransferase [Syntrophus sp. (in: bacteria)]
MSIPVVIKAGETVDQILEGKLKVIQKEKGHRFSIDALLLAHFIDLKESDHVLDLGTGGGIVPMILAKRWICGRIVGLDIQDDLIDMAGRSAVLNQVTDRVAFIRGDIRQIQAILEARSFDVVTFNPPYRRMHSGRMNPNVEKAIARHELKATLDDFLQAAAHCLKMKGRVFVIYPASHAVKLFSRMRTHRLEPKRTLPVYSNTASAGQFILVEGLKGGNEAMKVLPPLFIYAEGGAYTQAMQRIFSALAAFPSCAAG